MNISVFGTGYVGLVAGTCFAEMGNRVICCDIAKDKIKLLNRGKVPIYEPGLADLIHRNRLEKRLQFVTDTRKAVQESDILFIAVGTPSLANGDVDLRHVFSVARDIGRYMNGAKLVVNKSTVPCGTAERLRDIIAAETKHPFQVVSNPEFMKEGAAVEDFMRPDRIIIGVNDEAAVQTMKELYAPFVRTGNPIIFMDTRSAELTKYAANAMLATRVSFMNEIANLCERLGANVDQVRIGMGSDRRIGPSFLFPGVGYGGSCFPKDVQGILQMARGVRYNCRIVRATHEVNETQKLVLVEKILNHFAAADERGGARATKGTRLLRGKRLAVWGLAFKPRTDDVREAPALTIIAELLKQGAQVACFDPEAIPNAKAIFGARLHYGRDPYGILRGADALVVLTEWNEFRNPDFEYMKRLLKSPVIFDGRNIYSPERLGELRFTYYSIGRPVVKA